MIHIVLILLSFAFILIFSISTSILYPFYGSDSAVFQVLGKYWLDGILPYKDLFDHKGALLFLINSIGYAIHPRTGIMIPQIIFMYISLLMIWKMFELYFDSIKHKICFFILTLIYFISHYWEGNNASEYTIAFIAISAYCFMRFMRFSEYKSIYSFIYGFGFGACVLLRATNGMPICCFAILSAIFLIRDRKFKTLWNNILIFFTGFIAIILPFVIYFAWNDALYDAIYGTVLFNIKYAVNGSFHAKDVEYFAMVALSEFPMILMIAASILNIGFDRKDKISWSGLFSGIILLAMLMKLRQYFHYCLMLVPMFPLMFAVLRNSIQNLKHVWQIEGFSIKRFICKICLAFFIVYFGICLSIYWKHIHIPSDEEEVTYIEESIQIKKLSELIPPEEQNSLMMWGIDKLMARWILESGILPRYKFFYNQSMFAAFDSEIRTAWFKNVRENYPLWILYGGELKIELYEFFPPFDDAELEKLIEEKYIFKGEVSLTAQDLKLYRLK